VIVDGTFVTSVNKYYMIKVLIEDNKFTVIDDAESTPGQSYQLVQMKIELSGVKSVEDLKTLKSFKLNGIEYNDGKIIAYFTYKV